jgi:hypothetical protein
MFYSIIVSMVSRAHILPGYDGLEEFDELLTLVRCDMFFPDSTCLYRTVDWHLDLLVIQEYSLIDSDSVRKRFPVLTSYRKIDEL